MSSSFEVLHHYRVSGSLAMFDRLIFKGHLTRLYASGGAKAFLWSQGAPLTEFARYVEGATDTLLAHAEAIAAQADRPYLYLQSNKTRTSGQTKEEMARAIAARDGITEGLVCVLRAIEPSPTFRLQRHTGQLEVVRKPGKCLHFYFYLRHEAPRDRVGCKGPPPACRSRSDEAEGSLILEVQGRTGAALTKPGRVGTARRPGFGKQDGEVYERNQRVNPLKTSAGSNLVDMGRIAVHAREAGRLRGRSVEVDEEAMGKVCGVPMAMLQGKSWAPIPSNGAW